MASTAILAIKIIADAKGAQKGMAQAEQQTSKWASGMGKASRIAAVGLAGVGAVALSGAKAAAEDAQAQVVLAQALTNTAGATKDQIAATEDWITKTALATGVADDQLRPALANLVRGTKDVSEAQKAMGLALDVSAATGKDVESVSAAMAKAYGGNTTALGRLVPGLDKAVLKTKDMTKITAELEKMVGGTSAAAADTAAGKYQRLQIALDETKESAGAALLPAMEKLSSVMLSVANLASQHQGAFLAIASALTAMAVAVYVVNTALKVYQATLVVIRAVQAAAFLTNPVGLIIVAVIALVAAIVLLWRKSETFRNFVLGMWAAIKAAIGAVVAFFKQVWNVALAVVKGYFTVYKTVVMAVFTAVKVAITTVTNWFRTAWTASINAVKAIFRTTTAVITAPFHALNAVIEKALGWIQRLIDKIKKIKMPDLTPGFSLPDLPGFGRAAPAPQLSAAAHARGAAPTAAGGQVVNITVNGAIDPDAVARQIKNLLAGHSRRVGAITAPAGF